MPENTVKTMKVIRIPLKDVIIMKGIAKESKKEYAFIKLDKDFANNRETIKTLEESGARIYQDGKFITDKPTSIVSVN